VKVRPNSRYAEFVHRIGRSLKPKPWAGITFRSVQLEFASPAHVLGGRGSFLYGGRWNAPTSFPVVYSSTRPGTAIDESFQLAADFELSPDDLRPRVTCGIEWQLSSVINLTAGTVPSWLELMSWLKEDFEKINDGGAETLCQSFGRAAKNSGIVGIFSPSVRVPKGINLVVFRDGLKKADKMRLLGVKELAGRLK
jgi:RES domain-containing protein